MRVSDSIRNSQLSGRYQLGPVVERGRLGPRFTATNVQSNQPVIIEVIEQAAFARPEDQAVFEREATAMATLEHPGLASLVEVGELGEGASYIVSEALKGQPLSQQLESLTPMQPEQACALLLNLLDALAQAHGVGVIHGGVCPENLIVTRDEQDVLAFRLTGFAPGLSTHSVPLDDLFLAPEQASGEAATVQSDLYALGLLLQTLLTGHTPQEGMVGKALREARAAGERTPPELNGELLRGPLIEFMDRCLAHSQSLRPASADEAYRSVQRCMLEGTIINDSELVSIDDNLIYVSEHSDAEALAPPHAHPQRQPPRPAPPTLELPPLPPPEPLVGEDGPTESRFTVSHVALGILALVATAGLFSSLYALGEHSTVDAQSERTDAERSSAEPREAKHQPNSMSVKRNEERASTPQRRPADPPVSTTAMNVLVPPVDRTHGANIAVTAIADDTVSETFPLRPPSAPPSEDAESNGPTHEPDKDDQEAAPDEPIVEPVVDGLYVVRIESIPTGALVRSGKDKLGRTPLDVTWSVGSPPPVLKLMKFKTHSSYFGGRVHLRASDAGRTRYATLRVIGSRK